MSKRVAGASYLVAAIETMAWDLFLWILSFLISLALVASIFYQVICLTDLEADYMNPFETSTRINRLVLPEFLLQASLCILFLFTWHWFFFLVSLPVTCYHAMLYNKRRHLIDVTEVFRGINFEKKLRFTKLGFYIFLFILVVFRLTLSVVYSFTEDDDLLHLF